MNGNEKLNSILLEENVDESIRNNLFFVVKIIPEVKDMIGFEHRNQNHNLDVFEHTLKAMQNSPCDLEIRMALLLHDIGKPHSYQERGNRRIFLGHEIVSAKMSKKILKRLHYNEKFIENVIYLIEKHDHIINTKNLDNSLEIVKKRLEVQIADTLAHNPKRVKRRLETLNKLKEIIYKYNN